jgi:hypothetical protein
MICGELLCCTKAGLHFVKNTQDVFGRLASLGISPPGKAGRCCAGAFLFWGQALTKRRWVYYNHMHAKQGGTTPLDGYGNMFLCGTLGKPWA